MLTVVGEVIGASLLVFGTLFCVLGVYGMVRLPDTYNRLHAAGKVMTFGAGGVLLAIVFVDAGPARLKGLTTAAFLLLTAPVVTHVLGRLAYRSGLPLGAGAVRDDLAEDRSRRG